MRYMQKYRLFLFVEIDENLRTVGMGSNRLACGCCTKSIWWKVLGPSPEFKDLFQETFVESHIFLCHL